jgi:hypothetical protein
MNTKPDMTIPEATGYIVGVAMGLVRKFDKFFVIVLACILIPLVRVRIDYDLPSNSNAWTIGLIQGMVAGLLVAVGIILWALLRKLRK